MQIFPYKLRILVPPQDDLRAAILAAKLKLKEGDVVAISSKVVSIGEGACVPMSSSDKKELTIQEADWYLHLPHARHKKFFTIARGVLTGSSGIDESNGDGHYIVYPEDPFESARRLRSWLQHVYNVKNLAVIITDSKSDMLRRGAISFALAWDGIDPLRDYRGEKDLFGRPIQTEMSNIIDALAATAGLYMGEVSEQIPLVVLRGVPNLVFKNRSARLDQLMVEPKDDLFAPLMFRRPWRRGGKAR
jgi:dihydrofolate synthase / folylpolyglutamate synthase